MKVKELFDAIANYDIDNLAPIGEKLLTAYSSLVVFSASAFVLIAIVFTVVRIRMEKQDRKHSKEFNDKLGFKFFDE